MVSAGVMRHFNALKARKCVSFSGSRDASMSDAMMPDHLVTDAMIDRFLAIDPPHVSCTR